MLFSGADSQESVLRTAALMASVHLRCAYSGSRVPLKIRNPFVIRDLYFPCVKMRSDWTLEQTKGCNVLALRRLADKRPSEKYLHAFSLIPRVTDAGILAEGQREGYNVFNIVK